MASPLLFSSTLLATLLLAPITSALPSQPIQQHLLHVLGYKVPGKGHNELYIPSYDNPVPGKIPWIIDERTNFYEKYINGSDDGRIRRSSCPAVNTLANRGYIARSGRNISYEEIAQAARDVYNFGDDNVGLMAMLIHLED